MKALLIAVGVLLIPAAASAQVAAGAVPNTFDRPATAQAAAPAPAQPAAPALSPTPANAASADALRAFIAGVQTDKIDYAAFTDDLATKIREQAAQVTPVVKGFGAVQAVDFVGSREGVDLYAVTFANAETQWMIGFNEADKIAALLFRPAEPKPAAAAPAPSTPAPATPGS